MHRHATPAGTRAYADRVIAEEAVTREHFRECAGLTLGSLGMGTYLGAVDDYTDSLVTEAVLVSVAGGMNVIDTAINYRYQKAERSVGHALDRLFEIAVPRDHVLVCTKNGYVPGEADARMGPREYIDDVILRRDLVPPEAIRNGNCMAPAYLEFQFHESLKNLMVDAIDVMYLHNPAEAHKAALGTEGFYDALGAAFEVYERHRAAQRLLYYGLATWECFRVSPEHPTWVDLERVVDLAREASLAAHTDAPGFRFVQLPVNFLMREAFELPAQGGRPFLEKAAALGINVFSSVPLLQGQAATHPEALRLQHEFHLDTPALAALQYARSIGPPLVAPLVGHKAPNHVRENLSLLARRPASALPEV